MKTESQAESTNRTAMPGNAHAGVKARAGLITRYVAVRAGELLQVQAYATEDVELLMRSQLCGTIARKSGQMLEAGYLALEDEPVRIQVRHCPSAPPHVPRLARPSVQLMIATLPPGSAVSSDTRQSAAQLTDRQQALLERFGIRAGSLPLPMGQVLGGMLAALDTAARAPGTNLPAGASEHTLTVDRTSADRIEHCQYRLTGSEETLYLATSADCLTGELRCMLVCSDSRGVRVQGAAVHRNRTRRGPNAAADPVATYLGDI